MLNDGAYNNNEEKLWGEAGDDMIWAGSNVVTDIHAYGGTGDDKVYGGYGT